MDEAVSDPRAPPISFGQYALARLSAAELCLVRGFVQTARPRLARTSAVMLSRLGNGWAYLALAIGSVAAGGVDAIPLLGVGTLNVVVLHSFYPSIKRYVARPRPYQRDGTLMPLLPVLDQHSFPSGHAMTLPAVLVPLGLQFPQTIGVAFASWLL